MQLSFSGKTKEEKGGEVGWGRGGSIGWRCWSLTQKLGKHRIWGEGNVSSQQRPHKGGLLGHLTDSAVVFLLGHLIENVKARAKWVEMKANGTDHFSLPPSLK